MVGQALGRWGPGVTGRWQYGWQLNQSNGSKQACVVAHCLPHHSMPSPLFPYECHGSLTEFFN